MHAVPPWLKTLSSARSNNGFPFSATKVHKESSGGNSRLPVCRLAPSAGSLKQGDKSLLDSRQSLCCMKIVSYLSKQLC